LGEAVELVALFEVDVTEGVDCVEAVFVWAVDGEEATEELLLELLVEQLPPSKMDTTEGSEQE
jgi:hypothetical protein